MDIEDTSQNGEVSPSTDTVKQTLPTSPVTVSPEELYEGLTMFNFSTFFPDENSAIEGCFNLRLVPNPDSVLAPLCPRCGAETKIRQAQECRFGYTYKCKNTKITRFKQRRYRKPIPVQLCASSVSFLYNTFFQRVKTSTLQVLQLIYAWVIRLPVTVAARQVQVSPVTAVELYNCCREVAEIIVSNLPLQIGGPEFIVEFNEALACRRKYNFIRNSESSRIKVFGIYCRRTKEGIIWHVTDKNRRILWSTLEEYIVQGSIISDWTSQYKGRVRKASSQQLINQTHRSHGKISPSNPNNQTENLETISKCEQTSLKASLRSDLILQQKMCENTYRNRILSKQRYDWKKFLQFVEDIRAVYPGSGKTGLQLKKIGIDTDGDEPNEPYFDLVLEEEGFTETDSINKSESVYSECLDNSEESDDKAEDVNHS